MKTTDTQSPTCFGTSCAPSSGSPTKHT